jgi:hypothetical protein
MGTCCWSYVGGKYRICGKPAVVSFLDGALGYCRRHLAVVRRVLVAHGV